MTRYTSVICYGIILWLLNPVYTALFWGSWFYILNLRYLILYSKSTRSKQSHSISLHGHITDLAISEQMYCNDEYSGIFQITSRWNIFSTKNTHGLSNMEIIITMYCHQMGNKNALISHEYTPCMALVKLTDEIILGAKIHTWNTDEQNYEKCLASWQWASISIVIWVIV